MKITEDFIMPQRQYNMSLPYGLHYNDLDVELISEHRYRL